MRDGGGQVGKGWAQGMGAAGCAARPQVPRQGSARGEGAGQEALSLLSHPVLSPRARPVLCLLVPRSVPAPVPVPSSAPALWLGWQGHRNRSVLMQVCPCGSPG